MKTIPLTVDDELAATLEMASALRSLNESELVSDVLRRYFEAEKLRRALQACDLSALYAELEREDVMLAEAGMAEYAHGLTAADQ